MAATFKRKRLLVDRQLQFRMLARMTWYFLTFVVFVVHLEFVFQLMAAFATERTPAQGVGGLYLEYLSERSGLLWSLVLLLPVLLYDLLKFSHRFAGPLFRCRQVMRQMARGEAVPEFKPRKHDLMGPLFDDFNSLIRSCNSGLAHKGRADDIIAAERITAAPHVM